MGFEQKNAVELDDFKKRAAHAIREWPFFYNDTPKYQSGDGTHYVCESFDLKTQFFTLSGQHLLSIHVRRTVRVRAGAQSHIHKGR